jgi:hypothetical protein
MSISNTSILIKRSSTNSAPSSLKAGELAYSYQSNTTFIGTADGTGVVKIGGQAYTSKIDAATSQVSSNTLVQRDATGSASFNSVVSNSFVGPLFGNANTATALQTPQNFSISGGDLTASSVSFNGQSGVNLNASLNSISGLIAGTVGSSTSVPVIQFGANGRILSVNSAAISTTLPIAGNLGTSTLNLLSDTLHFTGTQGIITSVSGNTVYTSTDNTILRSNTSGLGPQTVGTDLNISGNLTVSGTTTYVNTAIIQTAESMMHLASNNTVGDVVDIGFVGEYNNGSGTVATGLVRDAGSKNYYLFQGVTANAITGNTIANNLFTTSNTATLYTNIVAAQANASSANITTAQIGTLSLGVALPVTSGGTGTTSSTGTGSVVLSNSPTFTGNVNFGSATVNGLNVATINVTTINVSSVSANSINIGSLNYVASGAFVEFGANTNSFQQVVIQNQNLGNAASADYIVSNGDSTDTFLYGDFGINGPGYSQGPGSLNLANAVYLYSQSSDLTIGTVSNNPIHFVTNSGTTDAMTIDANSVVSLANALAVKSGGTGQSSFTVGQVVVGNGTGGLQQLANVSSINATVSSNSTLSSFVTDVYGRHISFTQQAIAGLTVGQGGTGISSATLNGITYGNGTGAFGVTAAAGTSDQTWSNQIMTVTNSGVPTWSTALDGGTF